MAESGPPGVRPPTNGARLIPMRDWLRGSEVPWPPASDLDDGARIVACYSVVRSAVATTKRDKPYLRLELSDLHGTIQGRVWEDAERYGAVAEPGSYVGVRGRVEVFQGQRQVNVEHLERVRVDPDDLGLFMPRCPRDAVEMDAELMDLVASVRDRPLRALLRSLLNPKTETGVWFRKAPAAKKNHHAYVGGLLEHTLSVTKLCHAMAAHYGPVIDRDLLITGALLHDIGKIHEIATEAGFPYTTSGKLLGHILLGLELVHDAGRRLKVPNDRLRLVEHLIAAHQGRYEWQSPREPQTLEALVLHYADDTDA
nr:HD domain-containing protein [Gemmatimonadota bacterium]NIU80124.1 HD domain-containing protein [Gammaproteobacteria bacterium]NIP83621.1 HD domain-containing protein [Gemmatimonadota bacterium]NIQ59928.1 HD domain-containing protein [Gemmatimonadota bacterium]NIW38130.1 HD domain-containing protein [Gemmatimonadota bacterium]